MFSILWHTEFVQQFVEASALVCSSFLQKYDCNKSVCCVQTCHFPLYLRLLQAQNPMLHSTAPSTAVC